MKRNLKLVTCLCLVLVFAIASYSSCFAAWDDPSVQTTTAERNSIAYNWTYYQRGLYDNNCLAYSLGILYGWVWPWSDSNPTLQQAFDYMKNTYGYNSYRSYSTFDKTCTIACYGLSQSNITHFAKITSGGASWNSGTAQAKWGHAEIFDHSNLNPYTNNLYGSLFAMFAK